VRDALAICIGRDAELGDCLEKFLDRDDHFTTRQRSADTAVNAGAECEMARVAVEAHFVRVFELVRIAVHQRGGHQYLVARHELHTVDLYRLDTGARSCHGSISTEHFLGRRWNQLGIGTQLGLVLRVFRQMTELPRGIRRHSIHTANKEVEAETEQFVLGHLAAVNFGLDAKRDQIVTWVFTALVDLTHQIVFNIARGLGDLGHVVLVQQTIFPLKEGIHFIHRQPHQLEEDIDREAESEFVHEFAVAFILELVDIELRELAHATFQRSHPARREARIHHVAKEAVHGRINFGRHVVPVCAEQFRERREVLAGEMLVIEIDLLQILRATEYPCREMPQIAVWNPQHLWAFHELRDQLVEGVIERGRAKHQRIFTHQMRWYVSGYGRGWVGLY